MSVTSSIRIGSANPLAFVRRGFLARLLALALLFTDLTDLVLLVLPEGDCNSSANERPEIPDAMDSSSLVEVEFPPDKLDG